MDRYLTLFFEGYNIGAAFIIIFLIGQILIMVGKTDEKLLKARIFLSERTLQDTWLYMSIAGAGLGVHVLSSFLKNMGIYRSEFVSDIVFGISEIVFLTAFMVVLYQWFRLLEEIRESTT
ncbi:MAG: hypothetical protein SVM80_10970 [Halobacteriota archaeon]|nr:hypothetical protein [Halobacteriota archaeon]